MRKIIFIIVGVFLAAIVFFAARSFRANAPEATLNNQLPEQNINQSEIPIKANVADESKSDPIPDGFEPPLDRAKERVAKKPFGFFITPENSPIQPEKFRGYHTGTDFEIFPEELNIEIPVKAVCSGKLLMKKYSTGYGGVAAQACSINNQQITVVYGHLKLESISASAGDEIKIGDKLGILGKAYNAETGGERKHLHLGFHRGASINILGYVKNKSELSGWIDPCGYVCR